MDVHGIPYNRVISDPSTGKEFLFVKPEETYNPRNYSTYYQPVADTTTYAPTDTPSPTLPPAPKQLTVEEAQNQLVLALTARLLGTAYQPETFLGVVMKIGAQSLAESGVEEALTVLYPDSSNAERAAVRSVLIALADLKIAPDQLTQRLTKDIMIAQLKEKIRWLHKT